MNAARIAVVNLLVLAVGLGVLELCFGSWISDNRIRSLNLITDELYVHDVGALYDHGGRGVVYRRDEYGLRGGYPSPAEIGILTVGGSTTDQKYISEGETWQDVLQQNFARDGVSTSVVNAGVDGHSTRGHLRSFEWWFPRIPKLAPKYVLFYVGINDIHIETQRDYDRLEKPLRESSLGDRVRDKSGLYGAYRTLRGMLRASRERVGHRRIDFARVEWVDAPVREHHEERSVTRRRAYAQRLRGLARATHELGAEPIFVTQLMRSWKHADGRVVGTAGEDANGVDMSIISALFNRVAMQVCRAERAICVDLAGDLQPLLEDADYYDFIHMTPRGTKKVGDYLYRTLAGQLEF